MNNPFSGLMENLRGRHQRGKEAVQANLNPAAYQAMLAERERERAQQQQLEQVAPMIEALQQHGGSNPLAQSLVQMYGQNPQSAAMAFTDPHARQTLQAGLQQPEPQTHVMGRVVSGDTEEGRRFGIPPGEHASIEETLDAQGNVIERKRPTRFGAGQNITINTGEDKFAEAFAKGAAERANEVMSEATAARSTLRSLDQFQSALDDPTFEPGAFGSTRQSLSQIATLFGVDPSSIPLLGSAANAEQMESASEQLAGAIASDFGRVTNMSFQMARNAVPNLARTPEGNRVIMDVMRRDSELRIERAQALNEFLARNPTGRDPEGRTPDTVLFDFDAKNPVMTDAMKERMSESMRAGSGVSWQEAAGGGAAQIPKFAGEVRRMPYAQIEDLVLSITDPADWGRIPESVRREITERMERGQ